MVAARSGTGEALAVDSCLPKVLVVDDDAEILGQLRWALADDYQVWTASDREAALKVLRREAIPVVLLDLGLPPHPREASEGLKTLEEVLVSNPRAKIIIVSGNSERANAALAVQRGAYDIFPKPVDIEQLKAVLHRVHRLVALDSPAAPVSGSEPLVLYEDMVGSSRAMQSVFDMVSKVAGTDVPILISGESGTGKECVAAAAHRRSRRSDGPFVPINCGAIPENLLESELFGHERGAFTGATSQRRGKFEFAQGGTLFLDEIGELLPSLQVKLLRFLQEKVIERVGGREQLPVDARVVAATNQDLEKAVAERRFREDLYFRLAVVKIQLPPLRERGRDVVQLAERFIAVSSNELGKPQKALSAEATDALLRYSWPGNVRELQNRIKRAIVMAEGPTITSRDLELSAAAGPADSESSLREAKELVERELVEKALAENSGNISRAARALGISRPTLYSLMERYGLRKSS
jgi:two-component system NtrC family response regulator